MKKVFVDTAAWIALMNTDDDFHKQALEVKSQLKRDKSYLVTSDFVGSPNILGQKVHAVTFIVGV